MKLARNDPFRLYLIKKDNLGKGEGLMKRYLSRRIGNPLILNSHPPIPTLTSLLVKPIFSMFQPAIKIDFLVLAIFQCFY